MNAKQQHQCPLCWHEETMIARRNGREPIRDHMLDICKMEFVPPYGGARGQQCTRWDNGSYVCSVCGARMDERDLYIMLDAVGLLTQPFPSKDTPRHQKKPPTDQIRGA